MDKINSTLSIEQRELLDLHLRYVIEENKTTNLTRITDWETAKILHVEDSLVGVPFIEKAPQGDYLDMGTGQDFLVFLLLLQLKERRSLQIRLVKRLLP